MSDGSVGPTPAEAAQALQQYFVQERGRSPASLDRGVVIRRWAAPSPAGRASAPPQSVHEGAGDGRISQQEVFSTALEELASLRYGTRRFRRELCRPTRAGSPLCRYREQLGWLPPWLLDDGDPTTAADAQLRQQIDGIIRRARRQLRQQHLRPGTQAYDAGMTQLLLQGLFQERSEGGLGLSYENHSRAYARDGVSSYRAGAGACHGLSFIFYAMAARAGLEPQFIRVSAERAGPGRAFREMYHIGVSVRRDPSSSARLPVDPSRGMLLETTRHQWFEISPSDMMAYQFRNLAYYQLPAAPLSREQRSQRERQLQWAEALAPQNFGVMLGLLDFYRVVVPDRPEALRRSREYRARAMQINPSYQLVWEQHSHRSIP